MVALARPQVAMCYLSRVFIRPLGMPPACVSGFYHELVRIGGPERVALLLSIAKLDTDQARLLDYTDLDYTDP